MAQAPEKSRLFSLPEQGKVQLPPIEPAHDKGAELAILEAIHDRYKNDSYIRITPDGLTWKMDFGPEGATYIKAAFRQTHNADKINSAHLVFALDINVHGEVMGTTFSVRPSKESQDDNHPFVGYTRTNAHYVKQGLGVRRLVVLNEVSKQFYGETLRSGEFDDNLPGNPAIRSWENLVAAGLAEKTESGYRFKAD